MSHTIHKTANKLVTTLRHHIIHDTDNDTSPYSYSFPKSTITINALDWTFAATLTVIGRVALGYDFQLGVNNPDAVAIHTAWRSIARFSTSFAAFVIPLVVRAFPFTFLVHLPASGTIQAHGEAKDVIHKRAKKIIAEKQQHPGDFEGEVGSPEKQGQDFLSTLMQQDSRHDEDSVKDILEHVRILFMDPILLRGRRSSFSLFPILLLRCSSFPADLYPYVRFLLLCQRPGPAPLSFVLMTVASHK
ncbi:hypothetical protein FRB93_011969 [Tulasnella sp. JGI-2019a]|nr:hypothetical protein FRB93_011969 [Tulasnella sp. JGI-2019a]